MQFIKMQFISSDQQHISISNPADLQLQHLDLEKAHDEIIMLREQISSLQQYLSEQLQQQQVLEQELQYANQELQLMNAENQQLVEARQLYLEGIKEFARTPSVNGKPNRKALLRLLNKFNDEIAPLEAVSHRSNLSFKKHTA